MNLATFCMIPAAAMLAACAPKEKPAAAVEVRALPVMERVALGASRCWFKSKDPAFSAYRLAPELNSFTGTPARLDAFGPLMDDAMIKARVNKDVSRWARGGKDC